MAWLASAFQRSQYKKSQVNTGKSSTHGENSMDQHVFASKIGDDPNLWPSMAIQKR